MVHCKISPDIVLNKDRSNFEFQLQVWNACIVCCVRSLILAYGVSLHPWRQASYNVTVGHTRSCVWMPYFFTFLLGLSYCFVCNKHSHCSVSCESLSDLLSSYLVPHWFTVLVHIQFLQRSPYLLVSSADSSLTSFFQQISHLLISSYLLVSSTDDSHANSLADLFAC